MAGPRGDADRLVWHAVSPIRMWAVADQLEFLHEIRVLVETNATDDFLVRCDALFDESRRLAELIDGGRVGCWPMAEAMETRWQLDLTRLVLEARRLVAEDPGVLGTEQLIDGRRPSERWQRRIRDDGGIEVEYVGATVTRVRTLGDTLLSLEHREDAAASPRR